MARLNGATRDAKRDDAAFVDDLLRAAFGGESHLWESLSSAKQTSSEVTAARRALAEALRGGLRASLPKGSPLRDASANRVEGCLAGLEHHESLRCGGARHTVIIIHQLQ